MKRNLYLILTFMFAAFFTNVGETVAQTYSCQGHTYGCQYPTNSRRYAAINKLDILLDGVVVYSKTPDGCNDNARNGHYNVMNTKPAFTLFAGNTYQVRWNITNPAGYNGYQNYFVAYLDKDINGSYANAGEHISSTWGNTYSSITTHTRSFTLACGTIKTGTSRIRFRTDYQYGSLRNTATNHSNRVYYGETEEFVISLKSPSSIIADFNMDTAAYIGTAVQAKNTGNGSLIEWDQENDGTYDGNGDVWPIPSGVLGSYTVKNRGTNCIGSDSITKNIKIINPPMPVAADFVADKTTAQLYDRVQFYSISDFGPTEWEWHIYDSSQNPPVDYDLTWKATGTDENPAFDFFSPGTYTVCLRGKNVFGWGNWTYKKDYITITPFSEFDVSAAWGAPITMASGKLYDKGGEYQDYESNASKFTNFLAVIPCNAKKIDINFTQFKMADDNDRVYIFDGPDILGTPLHPVGGFKKSVYESKVPFTVTANSGAFFIYYESNGSGQDSGFIATWKSEQGSGQAPIADFKVPAVAYNQVPVMFENTSQNIGGLTTYTWDIDGLPYIDKSPTHTFTSDGTKTVSLIIETCLGKDTIVKTVKVLTPTKPANTDYEADNLRPKIDETVSFSVTNDVANSYEWSVIPPNFVYVNGTNKNSKEPQVQFTKSGCYTISLTAWNSINPTGTSKTIVKSDYICVVKYCEPYTNYTTTDISINNVNLKDNGTVILDNFSGVSKNGYGDYSDSHVVPVLFGKTYDLNFSRNTNTDPWNAKVWIDWNVDGDFDDPGEEILTEGVSNGSAFGTSFTVPDYKSAFPGNSRMRVAVGYKSNAPSSCGPMNIGEYEDYTLRISKDQDIPVIDLLGSDTVVMQKNGTYVEPGYTAIDPSEGDITSRVEEVSDLENDVPGFYTVRYSVCDNSGNCAEVATRYIKVVLDLTKPVITLANSVLNVDVNEKRACLGTKVEGTFDYNTIGFSANDAEEGDLTKFIVYDNTIVDINTVGTYKVEFSVQDVQGNKAVAVATVNVQDNNAPDILANGPDNVPLGSIWVEQTVACDKFDDRPVLTAVPGPNGFPNANQRGDYPVTYTATDASGNTSVALVRNYRVDDFEAPTIVLNTPDTVYHDVNEKYYTTDPTVTDNYVSSEEVSVIRVGVVDYNKLGTYTEMYTATDVYNNSSVRTRYIKVIDRVAPELSANTLNIPVGEEFWHMTGMVVTDNYYDPMDLMDAVEIVSSNVNIWVPGTYSIVYRVTDPSGNTSKLFNRIINVDYNLEKTIGINDLDLASQVNVYPVPSTNGVITIELNANISNTVSAKVVNLLGAEVMNLGTVNNKAQFDLSNLANGTYFVKITSGSSNTVKKIILN